jgi:hypothetical protein
MALDAGTALERPVLCSRRNEDYYFTLRAIGPSVTNQEPPGEQFWQRNEYVSAICKKVQRRDRYGAPIETA